MKHFNYYFIEGNDEIYTWKLLSQKLVEPYNRYCLPWLMEYQCCSSDILVKYKRSDFFS